MGLRDFKIPSRTVEFTGGSFVVEGLSFAELSPLIRDHGGAFAILFAKGKELADNFSGDGLLSGEDLMNIGLLALEQTPELVATAIAMAIKNEDMPLEDRVKLTRRLPAPVQVMAMEAVFTLTLATEGGLGNLAEMATRILGSMNTNLQALLAAK